MPAHRPIPKLVTKAEACRHLGIHGATFRRHWDKVFADGRAVVKGEKRGRRMVLDDELREAIEQGAGERGRVAAIAMRDRLGRLNEDIPFLPPMRRRR